MWSKKLLSTKLYGSRFDSLHEANNYEDRLKNQAIRSLCNHDYDEWEDYMFTLSKETI